MSQNEVKFYKIHSSLLKVTVDVHGANFLVRLSSGFDEAHDDSYLLWLIKKK